MRFFKQGVCLALLGAGLAAVPGMQATAAEKASSESLVQQMRTVAEGSVTMSAERATGKVGFVRAAAGGDLMPSVKGDSLTAAVDKASRYVHRYAGAFGARSAELEQSRVAATRYGWIVTFTQSYRGVPVFGSMLKANIDKAGDLTAVSGYTAPALNLSVTPRVSEATAAERAVATVRADPPGKQTADLSTLRADKSTLVVYRRGLTKGENGVPALAWLVEVSNGENIREAVIVDARQGKFLNRYSLTHNFQTDRELYVESIDPTNLIWKDGDPFPGDLDQEQQNLALTSGDVYWLFANTFQHDSYDGAGATMVMVNDYLDADPNYCPNASWNGSSIQVCDGTGPDDVVAHEWGHAYTEYTSGLIYQWQPGALNESYSDVWGETIDLINSREDAGEGNLDAVRPVGQCSTHSPPSPLLTINSPAGIAKECVTGGYLGPQPMPTITGDVAAPTDADEDGADAGATTLDGCSPYDQDVTGKVVLVDRGFCTFVQKAQTAKDEGAAGLIIGNRDEAPVGFTDADQTLAPTVSIGLSDRESIRTALGDGQTVNVTIEDASGDRVNSYRWLVGEKAESFGGALRDMWNPNCHGDPGKVSDVEYNCSTDDSGGVHGNSGVPNRLYALVVDGGSVDGHTVTGIGLDKAANLWWHAQTAHLTPTSDFDDMANSLESSCAELTGQEILALEIEEDTPAAPVAPITAADCASVTAAIAATEMRLDPTEQCQFEPILRGNAPGVCGKGTTTKTIWKENFEDGLKGWKKSERVFFEEGRGFNWKASSDAPEHGGTVAYAPDPVSGSCLGDADDISSANAITSKAISMSGGRNLRLAFEHYVATEGGWDGGNVKISVNGKRFKVIPRAAYTFNSPNGSLFSQEEGNSNPMAGEAAWTGTDGGVVSGSWGESQVNLTKAGVSKGDTVQIRFDFGRDGCNGVDGWYVDTVKVVVCQKKGGSNKLATRR